MTKEQWNPEIPDQQVRIKNNPSQQGFTTGKTRLSAGRLLVEVKFGPNEKSYKLYGQLELSGEFESIKELLEKGKLGNSDDLRRILTFEKVKGELTNIFYSMESSNTDFYPYQFKPILKFLDSPVSRLLIADEVGLGKTIEAMYIWKELQAREDARRLLIICPAMLRDKWRDDLRNLFNIDAEIIGAKALLEKTQLVTQKGNQISFVYIASLEGLRVKNWADTNKTSNRIELAKLLEENPANDELSLFDFLVIDEAHYLRNPETANNKFAQLLRDASRNLILLTATPIQTRSNNLYQLLKLVSPDDFFDQSIFDKMLIANKPIVDTLKLMWQTDPNLEEIKAKLQEANQSEYFEKSSRFQQLSQEIEQIETIDHAQQVKFSHTLESLSLLGQFMTRNRKREVLPDRVQRKPQTLTVNLTEKEKQVYDYITYIIRKEALNQSKFNVFRLMARQREMASCMVAALEVWKIKGVLKDFLSIEEDNDQELLYEIYGSGADKENMSKSYTRQGAEQIYWQQPKNPFPSDKNELEQFINELKQVDTKYKQLSQFLKSELAKNKSEKFVLFAYYRNTLSYLQQRLEADGIKTCLIQGGMERENKTAILKNFKDNLSVSVLLSSEVGSEGIDLQFCRFLINYDLPWNPMKVEQRIGRLDRLNQKHKVISIVNFSLKNTIEEYILERLYERINIFQESIGDLEEILGEKTEELIFEFLDPNLTEADLKIQANNTILAIEFEMEQQRKLENDAMNLVAFSDYILGTVQNSKDQGRWLKPKELMLFVADFFKLEYPGTKIIPHKTIEDLFEINLAPEAKLDLKQYCTKNRFSTPTFLYLKPVNCFFDSKNARTMGNLNYELIDSTHPLIQWIKDKYHQKNETIPLIAVSASQLQPKKTNVEKGVYLYVIQQWKLEGLRKENRLSYQVINLETGEFLSDDLAESLVNKTALSGKDKSNANNLINWQKVLNAYEQCDEELQLKFFEVTEAFNAENDDRCNVQERSVKAYARRKTLEHEQRIEKFLAEGKLSIIPAEEGKIKKINEQLNFSLKNIDLKRQITTSNLNLATGLIFVED